MYLAIFEFLGTSELLVILVVALIIFGPRKLPQLSRQLGKSLGEFKRASEDFKRTWEREVEMEKLEEEGRMARAMLQDDPAMIADANDRRSALDEAAVHEDEPRINETLQPIVARSSAAEAEPATLAAETPSAPETQSAKRDWL